MESNWSNLYGDSDYSYFGYSIDLNQNGRYLAVGGYGNNSNTGYVKSFQYKDASWQQVAQDIIGSQVGEQFGYSLDTNNNGNKIIIGANFNNDAYASGGRAAFFDSGALLISDTGKVLADSAGVTYTEGVNAYSSPPLDRNNNGVYDFLEVTRPVVVLQPESISVLAGESRTFTTSVSFFTTFDLQWQSSTNSGTTWTNINAKMHLLLMLIHLLLMF
jgi:hypothetical protein